VSSAVNFARQNTISYFIDDSFECTREAELDAPVVQL